MKKFSKLLAVVVAIAVVVCPMMSIVSSATSTGGYKIEAIDDNNLQLTISSTDGFIAYSASVGFNDASAFQSTYSSDGYTNGLKLIGYTTKTATKNSYNTPQISANATGSSLNILVMPTDINNLDLLTEVIIGIRVASNTTASLTKIQAADDGADITEDPTLLSFPAADANTGAIDSTASDYISSNATTNAHSHSFTQQTQTVAYLRTAATCTANATYWYSCATCGLASSTNYFTATGTMLAHTPDNTETFVKADATCTEDAQYWQECSVCHQQLSTYWTKPNTALNHSMTYHAATASTCEYQGNDAYYSCSRCNKLFGDSAGANEVTLAEVTRALADHTASNTKTNLKTAATCTADAVYYQQCSVCGIKLNTTWTDTGSKLPHTVVEDAAVPATCTATGLTAGSHCSVCGETIVAQTVVPATGHTVVEDAAVPATCTATGLTAGSHCSVCGETIVAQTVVPATGHTAVEDAAVPATCTETGLTAGSHCSVCGETIVAQTVVPALGHDFTYNSNSNGTHAVGCTRCDYAATEDCDTAGAEGACSKCGYKAEVACTHNYVGVVTTQPTKNATGVMTYTCSLCGDSYTETIAMPTAISNVTFSHTLLVSEVVADSITVSTKQLRTNYGNNATYFIDINYQTYSDPSDLYNLVNAHAVINPSDKDTSASTANKDVLYFNNMALYEMTLDFEMTLYIVDENGVVVAYRSFNSSLAAMALAMADQYPTNTNLLTCLADMCNYGKVAQEFFATTNPTKDIASAIDPTTILGDYMVNASDTAILPGAGEYDNTRVQNTKVDPSTGFISGGMTLSIGASNRIAYTLRADGYELDDCSIVMSYTSLYGEKEFTVDMSELIPNGLTSAGKQKYLYNFSDLAIYDVNAVVTMSMYHNGVLEMTSQYSVGYFVNQYVATETDLGTVIRAMELFANSTAIQLGQGSIF